jgi:hypothetical protein
MRTRERFQGYYLRPDEVSFLASVFDEVWSRIAATTDYDAEHLRDVLAKVILDGVTSPLGEREVLVARTIKTLAEIFPLITVKTAPREDPGQKL